MTTYAISDTGWISNVSSDIEANEPFSILVSGKAANDIIQRTSEISHKLANFSMFKKGLAAALHLVPGMSVLPVAPEVLMAVLAAIGALGGAVGAVATCAGIACSHNYSLALKYNFGKLFDPTDDSIEFQLTPPVKN